MQRLVHHRVVVAVAVASGSGVYLTSKDFLLTPIAAALMAGIGAALLRRLWTSEQVAGWKHVHAARVLSVAALPVAFTAGLRVDAGHAFREAFGIAAPAGLRELVVDANLMAPSGDRLVLMRFAADRQTVDKLLGHGRFDPDRQVQEAWGAGEDWSSILGVAFGQPASYGGAAWSEHRLSAQPDCRRWIREEGSRRLETTLLYDGAAGKGFVLYSVR